MARTGSQKPSRLRRAGRLLPSLALLLLAGCATTGRAGAAARPDSAAPEADSPITLAARARSYEDVGDYPRALAEWRRLRPLVHLDADLELATALDEARTGQLDSAATRLSSRVMGAAAVDTLPESRYHTYPASRDSLYVNGVFDGWHWYVWRSRAEVAAARGRWKEATVAARQCVAARPMSATEWLLLAMCAGQYGQADEAREAAREARTLDAGLPEAHYLDALWAWKDRRRAEAQAGFLATVMMDSTFQPAAVALTRSRLPGSTPDSLPSRFLWGARAVGMLTSPVGPKLGDSLVFVRTPILSAKADPDVPDSIKALMPSLPIQVYMFVDNQGRVLLGDLAWCPPDRYPVQVIVALMAQLPTWRFMPLQIAGTPRGAWLGVYYGLPRKRPGRRD